MPNEETNCVMEEEDDTSKKTVYTGILKDIKFHSREMFRVVFEDGTFVFVNNAHFYKWKKGADYKIRIIIFKDTGSSQIYEQKCFGIVKV